MELSRRFKRGRVCFQIAVIVSILICGFIGISARGQIPLVDSTFHPDLSSDGHVYAIVVQTNGDIVIGGDFDSVSGQPIANLARLHSDGTLDTSFPTGTDNQVSSLALQPDGKIIVGGSFTNLQGIPCAGLGRLLPDGEVDPNFNTGAFFDLSNIPYSLAIRPDGKILAGTMRYPGGLFQLTTNGALDATFTQTNEFQGYNVVWKILLEPNGDLIAGGAFDSVNDFASPGWAVLDANGNLKTNLHSSLAVQSEVFTILQQTNGGFLIGGLLKHTNGTANTVLDRLDSNFQPDTNFQTSAFTPLNFSSGPYLISAILQPDGKIVAGGSFEQVGGYFRRGIVRLDSAGKVDGCFDPGLGTGFFEGSDVVTSQPDGRILVGGNFGVPGLVPNNIVRYLPQSECDAIRVYIVNYGDELQVGGTCPPGGTNHLQSSTNLIDWTDIDVETEPLLGGLSGIIYLTDPATVSQSFYRIKKVQ
jgi:uncharacterized delta-60 repeat protein